MKEAHGPARLVYVIDFLVGPNGGTERQLLELLSGLDRRRFAPSLVVLQSTAFTSSSSELPCDVVTLGLTKLTSLGAMGHLGRFTRFLRATGAKLVHVYFNDASIVVPPFAKLAGCRVLASRRDLGFWHTPAVTCATRAADSFVDCFVANSHSVADSVVKTERVQPSRIAIIPNGLSLAPLRSPTGPGTSGETWREFRCTTIGNGRQPQPLEASRRLARCAVDPTETPASQHTACLSARVWRMRH